MNLTSVFFVFFMLPIFLVIYYLLGKRYQREVLLILSLLFYACGSMRYFLLLVISTITTLLCGRLIKRYRENKIGKWLLTIGIVYNIVILFYYKYLGFVIGNINSLFKTDISYADRILPLGLSFFTFKAIAFLVDIYKGKVDAKGMIVNGALYLTFFAQIQSGPISRYSDLHKSIERQRNTDVMLADLSNGIYRFVIGFNKKILIANMLDTITREIFSMQIADLSTGYAWLGAICYSLELFFDFSGYSDMAIGLSRMFGIYCPENFDYPYITASVSEFWRRWHITLGAWFRDYVYIPMGGSRTGNNGRLIFNLLVVWALTGVWHGADWNFIVWGLGYFVVITFEKLTQFPNKLKAGISRILYQIFVLIFVNFQWVLFRADGLQHGLQYIKTMLCYTAKEMSDERALLLLRENSVFIVLAIILSMPIVPFIKKKMQHNKQLEMVCGIIYYIAVAIAFVMAIAFVVAGQNNPFAYANF